MILPKRGKMKRLKWRNRHSVGWITHILCKTVVAMLILEGLNVGGSGGVPGTARVDGASTNSTSSQFYHNSHSGFRGGGGEYERAGDSFISTFRDGRGGDPGKRMRDRCGRYSLLRVLQQWENLQKRCRLGIRNGSLAKRNGGRYEYDIDNDNGFTAPPQSAQVDEIRREGKRSRHPYTPLTLNNYFDNENSANGPYRNTYYEVNGDALESCCPVIFEVIAPIYGRNRSGHMVELYKDEKVQQEFFEYRCHEDYLEKPCRYVDSHHRRISKCVQQYLDTYALVRSDTSMTGWSMEHIRVASGCACKVDPVKAAASRRRKKLATSQQKSQAQLTRMGMARRPIPDFFVSRGSRSGGDDNSKDKNKYNGRGRTAPYTPFGLSSLSSSRNGNIDY